MTTASSDNAIYLGRAGDRPGLTMLDLDRMQFEEVLSLPPAHSVYALDVNVDTGILAAGTRGGRLYCMACCGSRKVGDVETYRHCRGQLLAVCVLDESLVCSTDSTGQCLIWLIHGNDSPASLSTGGKTVCSLTMIGDDELMGLATDGCVLFWSVPDRTLTKCIKGPRPARKYALVNAIHWSEREILFYPTDNGSLAVWDMRTMESASLPAHKGDCYVVFRFGDHVVSVGANDRMCLTWDMESRTSLRSVSLPWPNSLIAGVPLDRGDQTMMLIDVEGTVLTYDIDSNSIDFIQGCQDGCYRSLVSTACVGMEVSSSTVDEDQRARQLLAQAQEMIERSEFDVVEDVCAELYELGYTRAALGLEARVAMLQKDLLKELGYRYRLYELLELQDHLPWEGSDRYLRLLEQFWMIPSMTALKMLKNLKQV